MTIPQDRTYSKAHEWVQTSDDYVTIGITDFAQDALGDIVYVDLPEVGATIEVGETIAEVESTKSVGEVYAPVTGVVHSVNEALEDQPETVNQSPYGDGWIVRLIPSDDADFSNMISASDYEALVSDL